MVGSDSKIGEANVLSRLSFDKVVAEAAMSDVHCRRYPIPSDIDPGNPRPVCFPRVDEDTIFPLLIDVAIQFSNCLELLEICAITVYILLNPHPMLFALGWVSCDVPPS